jgi:glutamate formiminotransferase / formiminotetrahydrofolate cyclodeaminase
MTLIECVPNFSEGRDAAVIEAVRNAAESVAGAHVLDLTSDRWHHRSVLTMAGTAEAMLEAAFAVVREATLRIDLRTHEGEHPRMGAADVVPFVPLKGATMDDCVSLARTLGERIGRELELPVYLYEAAATRPERRDLATVRRGGFEGLRDVIGSQLSHAPDFGPSRLHESAGAVAVGARPILVAFNVFLGDAAQLGAVREMARALRASSGGLPGVKALAFVVDERAQLSMNLTDLERTPAHVAYAMVLAEAERRGLVPTGSELIGLAPERVFLRAGVHALGLPAPAAGQTLEGSLRRSGLGAAGRLTDGLEDRSQPLTAGAAAALSATLGANLAASLAESGEARAVALVKRFRELGQRLESLAPLDAAAFDALRSAEAISPEALPSGARDAVLAAALAGASAIPLEIARAASDFSQLLVEGADELAPHALANAHAAAVLSSGACRAAVELIRTNVRRLPEPASGRGLLEAAEEFASRSATVEEALKGRLAALG